MFESNNNNEKEIFERNNEVKKSDLLQSETSNEETKQISPVVLSDRKSRVFVKKDLNTKRDQRLKEYINYQEDLDFFVKYNNSSDTGLFLNEISKLENFNDNYISRNLQNLQKDEVNFLNDLPALKAKIKYENMKREYEEKKRNKDVSKKNKRNNREERYYEIKRNVCSVNKNSKDLHELSEDDTSLPSLTEATLDGLYTESLDIQRKIIKKKDSGFAPRIKQFLKLEEISKLLFFYFIFSYYLILVVWKRQININ